MIEFLLVLALSEGELKNMFGSVGFGKFRTTPAENGAAILPKLASLEGLLLEAVRDEHAAAVAAG